MAETNIDINIIEYLERFVIDCEDVRIWDLKTMGWLTEKGGVRDVIAELELREIGTKYYVDNVCVDWEDQYISIGVWPIEKEVFRGETE